MNQMVLLCQKSKISLVCETSTEVHLQGEPHSNILPLRWNAASAYLYSQHFDFSLLNLQLYSHHIMTLFSKASQINFPFPSTPRYSVILNNLNQKICEELNSREVALFLAEESGETRIYYSINWMIRFRIWIKSDFKNYVIKLTPVEKSLFGSTFNI